MAQLEKNFDRRPDPDALLALTDKEAGGKLRVFLGAAPGVGKAYSMLAKTRALKLDGVDVVIGLVETHGRRETEALVEGLEILPRRKIEYRGRIIEEFDIDAALARKPKLMVVDELAHTNAPDSRHPKRWQDVEELLDVGRGCLDGAQHPTSRESGRRCFEDYRRHGARDGARPRPARGSGRHSRRHHAR